MDLLAHSVAPSICGWKAVDIINLVPKILWVSLQNFDVNFESRSETIESGSPCRRTTSFMYIDESSDAFTVVLTGTRWTIEDNLHMITQR